MERIQVNLRGLPSSVLEAVCRPDTVQNSRPPGNAISPLTFPKSKIHLWDSTPNGDHVSLHISFYRNPRLLLMEKALRLAHRHARQSKKPRFSCFFIGVFAVDSDEEGVTLTLDRFDPGREQPGCSGKTPTALLPGDVLVPCVLEAQHVNGSTVYSADDFNTTFKVLQHGCSSRETLELSKLLSLRVCLSCTENLDRLDFTLHWAGVTLASSLEAVPVRPVPVIPTALARTLISSTSMAQPLHTGARKRGFLTMDQTRKLLLMLESDPKVYTLPLVGVWLSGVTHIHNPVVWAWCLRYLYSSSLQDRVMSENGAFLVVLYSLTHRDPEFYQCRPHGGSKDMSFQLLISTESLTVYKNVEPSEGRSLLFELRAENQSEEAELFKEVLSRSALPRCAGASSATVQNKLSASDHDSGVEDEDLSPRPSPNPHPLSQQTRQVQPSVPELSMVLDGSFLDGKVVESHELSVPHPAQSVAQRRSSTAQPSNTGSCPPAQGGMVGPPPIRRPLTPLLSQPLASRSQSNIAPQAPKSSASRKSASSVGRRSSNVSSASSSSSLSSSPKAGSSPNDSFHQRAQRPGQGYADAPHTHPASSSSHSSSRKPPPHPDQTPMPQLPQHRNYHSTPAFTPCNCCSTQHARTPAYQSGTWQGSPVHPAPVHKTTSNPVHCPTETSPGGDCCLSPAHKTLGCHVSPAQSPVSHAAFPQRGSPSHLPWLTPSSGAVEHAPPACQAHCCQLQAGCAVQPSAALVSPLEGSMGILPADAYRMLMEQDRQLKQLQAQIQKLLDAQSKASEPPRALAEEHHVQQEQAVQTSVFTESQKKKTSVSIAVGTGASLFWSDPGQDNLPVEGHSEAPCQSSTVDSSTVSSRFSSENIQRCRHDESPATPLHSTRSLDNTPSQLEGSFQSPVLGESASMYYHPQSPDKAEGEDREIRDQRFYQELLGQVNNRLQDSVTQEEKVAQDEYNRGPRQSLSPRNSPPNKTITLSSPEQRAPVSEQDQVFSATLKQLHQLGVSVELDGHSGKGNRTTVESTSTLACINPEAVVPRLALSESVGASVWGISGGVDLSLEANAIALKYLSDSQLSRLSLESHIPGTQANPGTVLFGKTPLEKSSVGLSILSPSNMSLATCMYMKRYGLIEGGSSGEEAEEEEERDGLKAVAQARRLQSDSALGCSLQHDHSETVEQQRGNDAGFILKNITNKSEAVPLISVAPLNSQSQLIQDLRPKMQFLVHGETIPEKENSGKRVVPQRRSSVLDSQGSSTLPDSQGSVGNFLDLSRLRQLPKLF